MGGRIIPAVSSLSASYGRLMRRDVIDICLFIFIADVVVGVQSPIFALFATSLGAALGPLGVITSVLGLARLASALPAGMISDRLGPKAVLVSGMGLYAVSFVLYALAPSPGWLVVPRVLQACAMVATFPLGVAYIGDVVEARDRPAAIGIYTAAMGSGFAVGPLIGSWVSSEAGYPAAYLAGALIAAGGAGFGALRLVRRNLPRPVGGAPGRLVDRASLLALIRHPAIVMACFANIAMTISMTGAIFTYFPLYARGVGLSTLTIGGLFAWRAIASAGGRIPMGPLSTRLPAHWTLAAVLVVEAVIDFSLIRTSSPLSLAVLLIVEGIGFGVFLVSSQAAVSGASDQTNRGAAVGIFWMAGAAGEVVGLVFVGLVASAFGLLAVFTAVAATAVVCAVLVAGLGLLAVQDSRQHAGVEVATRDDAGHPAE